MEGRTLGEVRPGRQPHPTALSMRQHSAAVLEGPAAGGRLYCASAAGIHIPDAIAAVSLGYGDRGRSALPQEPHHRELATGGFAAKEIHTNAHRDAGGEQDLVELYNLITLLKPGLLATEAEFKKTFVSAGKPKAPRNPERLRAMLSEVMIRNTRGRDAKRAATAPHRRDRDGRADGRGEQRGLRPGVAVRGGALSAQGHPQLGCGDGRGGQREYRSCGSLRRAIPGVTCLRTSYGRGQMGHDFEVSLRAMAGLAAHPNVAGCLLVSFEPESSERVAQLARQLGRTVEMLSFLDVGGMQECLDRGQRDAAAHAGCRRAHASRAARGARAPGRARMRRLGHDIGPVRQSGARRVHRYHGGRRCDRRVLRAGRMPRRRGIAARARRDPAGRGADDRDGARLQRAGAPARRRSRRHQSDPGQPRGRPHVDRGEIARGPRPRRAREGWLARPARLAARQRDRCTL